MSVPPFSSTVYLLTMVLVVTSVTHFTLGQLPTESGVPNFRFFNRTTNTEIMGTNLTLRIGDNISLVCDYTFKNLSIRILRWHPDQNQISEYRMRKFMYVIQDDDFHDDFSEIIGQFSELKNRISQGFVPETKQVWLNISNFQFEDAGDFGCVATRSSARSSYSNLSIAVYDRIFYADVQGLQQQVLKLSPGENQTTVVNCSLYHVYGLDQVDSRAWFDRCTLFDAKKDKLSIPNCAGELTSGTVVAKTNYSDPQRYGEFWPRRGEKTTIQASFTLDANSYGKSIGCFGQRNEWVNVSDFVTFVQEGVDLGLDPPNFSCSKHVVNVTAGEYTTFYCVVEQPAYRNLKVFWELIHPNRPVITCNYRTDCGAVKNVFVTDPKISSKNLYVSLVRAEIQVKADPMTAKTKYRVVVTNQAQTFRSESANFTMNYVEPVTGAVSNSATMPHVTGVALLFMAVILATKQKA